MTARPSCFALAVVMDKFHCLGIGLGVVPAIVAVKMPLSHPPFKSDTFVPLGVILMVLTVSVVASWLQPGKCKASISPASKPVANPSEGP